MTVAVMPPQRVRHRRNSCDDHRSYLKGCPGCRERSRDAARDRGRMIVQDRWDSAIVDAAPAKDHILVLTELHLMTQHAIAEAAGVTPTIVNRIRLGARTNATQWTVDAICAVPPKPSSTTRIPVHGTARRLQALAAAGYDAEHVAELLGDTGHNVRRLRRMRGANVTAGVAARVKALSDRIGDTHGPSQSARDVAATRRWPRLIEWDDAAIDDPNAVPPPWPDSDGVDERVVAEAARGRVHFNRLTTPERVLLYRLWCQQRQNAGLRAGGKPFSRAYNVGQYVGLRIARIARDQDLTLTEAAGRRPSRKAA